MNLTELNKIPTYTTKIPSTGESITYRPYLAGEQKILLIALESKDELEINRAIKRIVEACVSLDDISNLTLFDVEYIFLQLRSKAVGEVSSFKIKCASCEKFNDVSVPLPDVKVDMNVSKEIKISDTITLVMKYPKYGNVLQNETMLKSKVKMDVISEIIYESLDKIKTEDRIINLSEYKKEDIEKFINSLNGQQFEAVLQFITHMPALKYDLKYKCVECGHDNEYKLRGISDFF